MDWAHPVLFRDRPAVLCCNPALMQVRTLQGNILQVLREIPSVQIFPSEAAFFQTTDENLLALNTLHKARVPCSLNGQPGYLESQDGICQLKTQQGKILAQFPIFCAVLDFERQILITSGSQFVVKSEFAWFLLAYLKNAKPIVLQQPTIEMLQHCSLESNAQKPANTLGNSVQQFKQVQQSILKPRVCDPPAFLQNAFYSIALRNAAFDQVPREILEKCIEQLLGPKVFYRLGVNQYESRVQLCFSVSGNQLYFQSTGLRVRVRRVRATGKPRYFKLAGDYLFALRFNTMKVYQTSVFLHPICRALAVLGKAVF